MKIKPVLYLSAAVLALTSCRTTAVNLADYSPAAIMTVYSNNGVPWYQEKTGDNYELEQQEDGILTGFINRALDKNNPETLLVQERVDSAARIFADTLAQNGIQVIEPATLKDCPAYRNAGTGFFDTLNSTVAATGYDVIGSSSRKLNKMTAEQTGAKALVYVKFRFQKETLQEGFRNAGVCARVVMTVYAADSQGKSIINKEYTGRSAEYTPLRNNNWNRDEVCSYFEETVQTLSNRFAMDFLYNSTTPPAEESVSVPDEAVSIPAPQKPASDPAVQEQE